MEREDSEESPKGKAHGVTRARCWSSREERRAIRARSGREVPLSRGPKTSRDETPLETTAQQRPQSKPQPKSGRTKTALADRNIQKKRSETNVYSACEGD